MILLPEEPYLSDPVKLLALCVWREARGECMAAKIGVVDVILNRCTLHPQQGFGADIASNVLHPGAFSSFNEGDPNSIKYPRDTDPSWLDSLHAAAITSADTTGGAVFYYSPPLTTPPHAWGKVQHTATIGTLQFYRVAE